MKYLLMNSGGYDGLKDAVFPVYVEGKLEGDWVYVDLAELLPHGYNIDCREVDIGTDIDDTFFVFSEEDGEIAPVNDAS